MKPQPSEDHIDSQLAAYAIGALDADELAELERTLALRPERQADLEQLRQVVGLLPFAAVPAAPPAHVRERLLAQIAASQAAVPTPRVAARVSTPRAWGIPAAVAVLAMLLLLLSGITLTLRQSVADLNRRNSELVATLVQLKSTLDDTRASQAALSEQLRMGQQEVSRLRDQLDRDQYLISFVSGPGVATRRLAAANDKQASGEMYMYPGHSTAVVIFSGLPALGPGKIYQFWLADAESQVPAGTFSPTDGGLTTLLVEAPREVNAYAEVMVTVEDIGGSQSPSPAVVLSGAL